ncbi:MAG: ATP-dependent DNA helicase RecG [Planctomycetes bacterium]|nr:ATP-dependent DNA helicase RecG [Planctomycetota bacterium]
MAQEDGQPAGDSARRPLHRPAHDAPTLPRGPAVDLLTPIEKVLAIVTSLRPAAIRGLAALELTNVGRLIAHVPMRVEKLAAEAPIAELVAGQNVSARGEVVATRILTRPATSKPRFQAAVVDGASRLDCTWFNMSYLQDRITPGMRIRVEGKLSKYLGGLQLVNPKWEALPQQGVEPALREEILQPVYPASERAPTAVIHKAILTVLDVALPLIEDHLPDRYRSDRDLVALAEAYRLVHAPAHEDDYLRGRRRLAFDELLLLQLGVHLKRAHLRQTLSATPLTHSEVLDHRIRALVPFELTPAQDSVVKEVVADLTKPTPANRLIQGDVGAGKTIIALYGMLMAAASGHQAALMAPTEILAEQHFKSITQILANSPHSRVQVRLLTGATPAAERRAILKGLVAEAGSDRVDLLIGTHALLTESVRFASLAVAIIDEQHRFGVAQRARLRTSATVDDGTGEPKTPHVIVMTATPIPRTLAITLFGDLDISTVRGLPPGRKPITTRVVKHDKRSAVYEFVRERIEAGEQAFIVAPAIEDAGNAAAKSVKTLMLELQSGLLKGCHLAMMHGKLAPPTRDEIMGKFRAREIQALVATTVIEVGVDIPNATVMVIEDADRFGLAQLHQLRGRVGRGERASVCALLASGAITESGMARLEAIASTQDGFKIAEVDFELRGPGEIFGTRQSGLPPFKVADLAHDMDLLNLARIDAAAWVARSPELRAPDERLLRRRLMMRYGESLGLGDVG